MPRNFLNKVKLSIQRKKQNIHSLRYLGKPTYISGTASFAFHENISIGQYCRIGEENRVDGEGGVTIGDGSALAQKVVILSGNHNYDQVEMLPYDNTDIHLEVIIGRGVWIGWGAIILPGVSIGDGAIVAAGSVVSKSVENGQLVGGNPAKLIRTRSNTDSISRLIAEKKYYLKYAFENDLVRNGRMPTWHEVVW